MINFNIFISRLKRRILSHLIATRIVLGILAASVVIFLGALFFSPVSQLLDSVFFLPRMALVFLFGSPQTLEQTSSRTNILLLGVGGAGHEAPELTDTMIFTSFDHTGRRPVFVSLPRDIWIPSLRAKLNTAYYYGNQKKDGGGLILARASVSEIFDQPVHYALALDFSGFVKLAAALGGLEINVDRGFDDYKYPIPGRENDLCDEDKEFKCRYEHIRFEKGKQILDGETALKFVRSRNAEGEEGTDFARAARQQKVLEAIKGQLFSPQVILNPGKILALWKILTESFDTNIPQEKIPILARMYLGMSRHRLQNIVLDGGGQGDSQIGFLVNPPISIKYDFQWVLVPRDGSWEEARKWLQNILYPQN